MKLKNQIKNQSRINKNFRMPQTREERLEIKRQYRINNREKIAEYNKQWIIDNAEYHRQYRIDNAEHYRQYRQENKEKKAEYNKQYLQTAQGKKVNRISEWKHTGLVDSDKDNYESLYNHYINTQKCEKCDIELTEDKSPTPTRKCMDHSHTTGLFRNILCQGCNTRRRENNF